MNSLFLLLLYYYFFFINNLFNSFEYIWLNKILLYVYIYKLFIILQVEFKDIYDLHRNLKFKTKFLYLYIVTKYICIIKYIFIYWYYKKKKKNFHYNNY